MRLTYDPQKRADTLEHGGIDFEDARQVFASVYRTIGDDRRDYGEVRWQAVRWLNDTMVMVVWTERDEARHIISMRKCNARERTKYR